MLIGFTSTTLRQIHCLEKIVEIAVDAGADCIEWGNDVHVKDVETAKLAKKLCDENDITISSYATFYRVGCKEAEEWKRICEIANAMCAKSVRVWLGKANSEEIDSDTYKNLVEDARLMCDIAKDYGLSVCPECHDNTFNNDTDAFLKIRKDIDRENFRTYFQSRYCRKEYDLDRIERTLPFIDIVHISFSEVRREQFPRFDSTYINTLLNKITACGFDGTVLLEFTYPSMRHGFPFMVKKDISRLKKLLK